jgi:argininosuccinate lyase
LVKGLPLAYNRDLQEDKGPLFDAFDTVEACLELATVAVDGMSFRIDQIENTLDEGFLDATTLMECLIKRGVPQRTAHEVIGRLVAFCERRGLKKLADLSDSELSTAHPELGRNVRTILGVQNVVKAFRSHGSTAPGEVTKRTNEWIAKLAER